MVAMLDCADIESVTVQGNDTSGEHLAATAAEAANSSERVQKQPVRGTSSAGDAARIQEILEDIQPRTWVFIGDNLGFEVQQARRGWVEHFSDFIKERLTRKHDMILNSLFADSTVTRLIDDIDWRALRFQPDVVLIMPGIKECAAHGDQENFRDRLEQLVEHLHNEGCKVVLNTPPCPAIVDDAVRSKLKTSASRIRSVANHSGAVLADHFSHWHAALQQHGHQSNLHEDSGQQPSARGHRELARRLLKSLNIRSK